MTAPQQHHIAEPGRELLKDVKSHLPPKIGAEEAMRAVMCTFSQHVAGGEVRELLRTLPPSLQPLLERCMTHRGEEVESFGRDQLIVRVAEHLAVSLEEAERSATAVLNAISSRLSRSAVRGVTHLLSAELQELWIDDRVAEPHPLFLEIEQKIQLPRGVDGQRAMMYVLCNLTRRLSKHEARHLADALPHEVRPLLEPCLTARGEEAEHFLRHELLEHIGKDLRIADPEPVVRTVLDVVKGYLRPELVERVRTHLPADVKELWHKPPPEPQHVQ
jgi:uncharacterized protein (DUF2267 family)